MAWRNSAEKRQDAEKGLPSSEGEYNGLVTLDPGDVNVNDLWIEANEDDLGTPEKPDIEFYIDLDKEGNNDSRQVAITGQGWEKRKSYASGSWSGNDGWEPATLESWIGSSWPLKFGTGFEDISIVSTVPEPSSALPLLGLCGLAFFTRRRK